MLSCGLAKVNSPGKQDKCALRFAVWRSEIDDEWFLRACIGWVRRIQSARVSGG